jgi:predicted O-methyltransferase YrrM
MNLFERISGKLIFQKIKEYQRIEGWLSVKEAVNLYRFASKVKRTDAVIVEIGSWKGKSTYCLAKGLSEGIVITIDPFDASGEPGSVELYQQQKGYIPLVEQFKNNMRRLNVLEKIEILVGHSEQFAEQFSKIDLLFIDGDHSIKGCESNFLSYSPALVSGGYLLFHDYDAARKDLGPTWVIENRVMSSSAFRFVGLFDSLWVAQKV